jgi:hypothetical protein
VLLDRPSDISQQRIAGGVTLPVIHLLEPVDVDIGEHQTAVPMASAVDLTLQQEQPDFAAERPRELIDLSTPKVISAV